MQVGWSWKENNLESKSILPYSRTLALTLSRPQALASSPPIFIPYIYGTFFTYCEYGDGRRGSQLDIEVGGRWFDLG